MMKNHLNKIASILALIIGSMAIFAGGKVLLGNDPGYYVINWVPVYNYSIGLLTVFITAVLLWRGGKLSMLLAAGTFSAHLLVMVILQTAFRDSVATESVAAMTVRLIVWAIILTLMTVQRVRNAAPKKAFTKESQGSSLG